MVISKWNWIDATVFLADKEGELIGTGFVIRVQNPIDESPLARWMIEGSFLYLVTAHHVIRNVENVFATLRMKSGDVKPVPVGRWETHPTRATETDVAVAAFEMPDWETTVRPVDVAYLRTGQREPLVLGHDVYYAGLLTHVPSMGARMVPMVRAGKLGAWDQPQIPFRPEWMSPDDSSMMIRGHLIDSYGYYGFSGSPCFLAGGEHTSLLGVLVGFFDFRVPTSIGLAYELPVNAGVAIVAPAWDIAEILNKEVLVEDRRSRGKETKRRERTP